MTVIWLLKLIQPHPQLWCYRDAVTRPPKTNDYFEKIHALIHEHRSPPMQRHILGQPTTTPLTFADGNSVEILESAKEIGVYIDSSSKPLLHCKEAYAPARATIFMMRRGFAILTPAIFRPLYLAMVRPHLDYAVQTSFPNLQKDIELMERMQRITTRFVKSFRKLPHPERLYELKLPSVER